MKNTPRITELIQEERASKSISTISNEGKLHTIAIGAILAVDTDTIAVAEVFMNVTSKNLTENSKAAFLVTKGRESYLLNAIATKRHTDGQLFDTFVERAVAMNIQVKAVWTFSIDEIYDESASPTSGTKLF